MWTQSGICSQKGIYEDPKLRTCWRTYFPETSILAGFVKLARCNLVTFVVIVAEKRYVVRSFGMTLRILSIIGPKSISKRRSASSRTLKTLGIASVLIEVGFGHTY